jgi:hypothetical protein
MLCTSLAAGFPARVLAAASPDEAPFVVDEASLGKNRKIKKQTRPVEHPRRNLTGANWEIRASTEGGRARSECLYSRGEKRFCRVGGFAGAFESVDGKHVLLYSAGPGFDHAEKKFVGVFEVESGKKVRETTIDEGSSMAGAASPKGNLFVAYYQKAGGGIVVQAFDMLGNPKWRRDLEGKIAPSLGKTGIAIDGKGKRVLLAAGGLVVISAGGDIIKDVQVDVGFIELNPARDEAVLWSRRGYQVYSIADDKMLLSQKCASGKQDWCLVQGFSPDGRMLSVIGLEEKFPADKKQRLVKVDLIDLKNRKVHRDVLNEEMGSNVRAEFGQDGSLRVMSTEKTISYETVP